ncbi:MAG: hypothetical protein KGJ79_08015 [Alphaproteobacteria bacterium]|nr:hypothetical protein [Alphaproteobacteria bacterium]MDE2111073.1 hypothetical protein [Alphaproteobacteria bacterium]MDE2494773.1 hypothetical protein [Alphaproteobacteria bacterium]
MQLSRKALNARWAWTSTAAAVAFLILNIADSYLRAKSGYGVADLQGVKTGWGIRMIVDRWTSPPDAALAGFGLGFDYLFMPLYAAALYYGAIEARERFAAKPGLMRRIVDMLAAAPIAAALFDACENGLQLTMMLRGPSDLLAMLAGEATMAKFIGVYVGLALALLAILGLFVKPRKKDTDGD